MFRLLVFLVLSLSAGCHHVPNLEVDDKPIAWVSFRWVTAVLDGGSLEHATLVLDAKAIFSESSSLLQLDLAASGNMPVGFPVNSGAPPAGMVRPRGRFYGLIDQRGGRYILPAPSRDSAEVDAATLEIGTVGLPTFERRLLLVDYPHNRLAILADAEPVGARLGAHARFTDVTLCARDRVGLRRPRLARALDPRKWPGKHGADPRRAWIALASADARGRRGG